MSGKRAKALREMIETDLVTGYEKIITPLFEHSTATDYHSFVAGFLRGAVWAHERIKVVGTVPEQCPSNVYLNGHEALERIDPPAETWGERLRVQVHSRHFWANVALAVLVAFGFCVLMSIQE